MNSLWFVAIVVAAFVLAWWLPLVTLRKQRITLTYSPRGDRVIVKRLPQEQPKEGEVIIPGSQRGLLNEGIVIAVGPAKELADLQIGQHVCFLEFAGTTIEVDGEEYLSMREQEIHGVRKA